MGAATFRGVAIAAVLGSMAGAISTAALGSRGAKTVAIVCHYPRLAVRARLDIAPSFAVRVDELVV